MCPIANAKQQVTTLTVGSASDFNLKENFEEVPAKACYDITKRVEASDCSFWLVKIAEMLSS